MSARLLYIASFSLLNLIQIPAEVTFSRLPASDEGKNGDMNKVIQSERLLKSRYVISLIFHITMPQVIQKSFIQQVQFFIADWRLETNSKPKMKKIST